MKPLATFFSSLLVSLFLILAVFIGVSRSTPSPVLGADRLPSAHRP